jgi:hypothetical protein
MSSIGNMFNTQSPAQPNTDDQPFNSNEPGDMGEGFDIPPIPVGVLRGHVAEAKNNKGNIILNIQCDDPSYSSSDEVTLFIGGDMQLLGQVAGSLGVVVTQQGGRIYLQDSEGNKDLKALNGKAGLFIFAPFKKDGIEGASVNKFGLPKPKSSDLWDSYMEQSNFSELQIAAIKKSRGGAVPPEHHHLFTE